MWLSLTENLLWKSCLSGNVIETGRLLVKGWLHCRFAMTDLMPFDILDCTIYLNQVMFDFFYFRMPWMGLTVTLGHCVLDVVFCDRDEGGNRITCPILGFRAVPLRLTQSLA